MKEGSRRGHSAGGVTRSRVSRERAWARQGSLDIRFKVRTRGHKCRCPPGLAMPGGRPGSEQSSGDCGHLPSTGLVSWGRR